MFTDKQLSTMFDAQKKLNNIVSPTWETDDCNWNAAILVECVEALSCTNYKWWASGDVNLPKLKMELVDIWCFAISNYIIERKMKYFDTKIIRIFFDERTYCLEEMTTIELIILLSGIATTRKFFSFAVFKHILISIDMSFDEVYNWHIAKNTLNILRQDNGYKEGAYNKIWSDGITDEEYLIRLLQTVSDLDSINLYEILLQRYQQESK